MSGRISKYTANSIVSAATKKIREDNANWSIETEDELGKLCWEGMYSDTIKEWIKNEPQTTIEDQKWLVRDSCLRVNCNGWQLVLSVKVPLPVPYGRYYGCHNRGNVPENLVERVKAYALEKEKRETDLRELKYKLYASVHGAYTFKKLKQHWPEGEEFYLPYMDECAKKSTALAIPFTDINKVLGLEIKEEDAVTSVS